jgi:hypothetical protein
MDESSGRDPRLYEGASKSNFDASTLRGRLTVSFGMYSAPPDTGDGGQGPPCRPCKHVCDCSSYPPILGRTDIALGPQLYSAAVNRATSNRPYLSFFRCAISCKVSIAGSDCSAHTIGTREAFPWEENMRALALVLTAATGVLLVPSSNASATPANGAAIARAAQQTDSVITVRPRCPNGQVRDSHGYCRPSARGF